MTSSILSSCEIGHSPLGMQRHSANQPRTNDSHAIMVIDTVLCYRHESCLSVGFWIFFPQSVIRSINQSCFNGTATSRSLVNCPRYVMMSGYDPLKSLVFRFWQVESDWDVVMSLGRLFQRRGPAIVKAFQAANNTNTATFVTLAVISSGERNRQIRVMSFVLATGHSR